MRVASCSVVAVITFLAACGSRPVVHDPNAALGASCGDLAFVPGDPARGLDAFCLDRTEVTVARYRDCVGAGSCVEPARSAEAAWFSDQDERRFWSGFCNATREGRDDHPINCVGHAEAESYCRFRGERLPTNDEWERAAFGGDGRAFPWGNEPLEPTRLNACAHECADELAQRGRPLGANSPGIDGFPDTAPVGSFPRGDSPFGLHDMAGNVWEWTAGDGLGDGGAPYRGRGWSGSGPSVARASYRGRGPDWMRVPDLGFRCARAVGG